MKAKDTIEHNIRAHNRIARRYEKIHDEIFNDIEQARIHSTIAQAVQGVQSAERPLRALDVGCGSGNLTRHLIDVGVATVSADVSENFLELIERDLSNTGLSKTLKINGRDLANIDDCTFNIAATYSVLHHVEDYLYLVREMCRVLRHGGVLYIDHEANETPYGAPAEYVEFLRLATPKGAILRKYLRLLVSPEFYINFAKKRINPRFAGEGDIHVWPDDHIEWDKIEQLLLEADLEMILKKDYLLYRRSYRRNIYEKFMDRCSDMRMLLARKK